jgi:hypothetical protein
METKPDKWLVIKIGVSEPIYKVFASWYGGYLDGDSWKINSGISEVLTEGNYINFYGHSGSCYKCQKNSYGITSYGQRILDSIMNNKDLPEGEKYKIEVMDKNIDWENLINN